MIRLLQFSPEIANAMQKERKLSSRELEVLSIICRGYTIKVAAQRLFISPKTVLYHLDNIKKKTGFRSKMDLIELSQNFL